jgi:hypothetical protein
MSQQICNVRNGDLKKKVKVERIASLYVHPMFAYPPKIIFDKKVPLTHKQFIEAYGLCNIGPFPKKLKLGLDYTKEEVLELFGFLTNKNGYHYNFNNNLELVKHIENLWMIAHQHTKMPTMQIINKALA